MAAVIFLRISPPHNSNQHPFDSPYHQQFNRTWRVDHSHWRAPATLDDTKKNWQRLAGTIEEKPFVVDYASFIAKDNLTFIEFYIQISYNRLRFARAGKFYQAIYDIDLYLQDASGNLVQTLSESDTVRTNDYAVTGAANNFRITLLHSCLRPGDYNLRAIITDKEYGQSYEVAQPFSARDFSGQGLAVSDLQFSRNIRLDSLASPFNKHGRHIEPNVRRQYGQFASQLFVYYEIYHLADPIGADAAGDSIRTIYSVRDENGTEVKQL
jgi:hypothetical protein